MSLPKTIFAVVLLFNATVWAQAPSIEKPMPAEVVSTDLRAEKMKWHRRFSYLTFALAAGAAATKREGEPAKSSHEGLGTATAAAFLTSSYFYWTAPKLENPKTSQKAYRIIQGLLIPLMILLPFAGEDASHAYEDGKEPDGIGEHKKTLAGLTLASLVASVALIHFEF